MIKWEVIQLFVLQLYWETPTQYLGFCYQITYLINSRYILTPPSADLIYLGNQSIVSIRQPPKLETREQMQVSKCLLLRDNFLT